jgi:hypothetical protein
MKKIILFAFLFAMSMWQNVSAQCANNYSTPGVYPDSLPAAYEQVAYTQEVDFTIPADTVIFGTTYHFDSAIISSITGFPGTQFTYTCSNSNCQYAATGGASNVKGCVTVTGIAPKNSVGARKLYVDITFYFTVPGLGAQNTTITDSSVNFKVLACTASAGTITPSGPTSFCPGDSVTLSSSAANGLLYQWIKNNADITNETTRDYIAKDNGSYKFAIKDTATGCADTSAASSISLFNVPAKPTITQSGNILTCSTTGQSYEWKKGGSVVSGANAITLTMANATFNGTYAVRVRNQKGCYGEWSDDFAATWTNGVDHLNTNLSYTLMPNPAKETVTLDIESRESGRYILNIIDITGKVVSTETLNIYIGSYRKTISTEKLSAGIYQIQLNGNNAQTSKILVKE